MNRPPSDHLSYKDAGVDIAGADLLVETITGLARATHTAGVVKHTSGYAGLFRPNLDGILDPLIAVTCDGVGTKLMVARDVGDYSGLGQDLVAMSVNDLLPLGARPLLFLDYLASGKLEPRVLEEVVASIARACQVVGCALIGGETAEMPGLYPPGDFDIAGFAVGIVDGKRLPEPNVAVGDVVLGLPSSGVHSNGISLARKALFERGGLGVNEPVASLGQSAGAELLEPTALYVDPVLQLHSEVGFKAAAHITGGGLTGRGVKLLANEQRMVIDKSSFERPAIFGLIAETGNVTEKEMLSTFNMGLGFLVILSPNKAEAAQSLSSDWRKVGVIEKGTVPEVVLA